MSDLTTQTLVKLCKNIREKKVSSTEVTKAFIERSEKSKIFAPGLIQMLLFLELLLLLLMLLPRLW